MLIEFFFYAQKLINYFKIVCLYYYLVPYLPANNQIEFKNQKLPLS